MKFNTIRHQRRQRPEQVFRIHKTVFIKAAPQEVFEFCRNGENFARIFPDKITPTRETDEMLVELDHVYPFHQWFLGLFPVLWEMHITDYASGQRFTDEQLRGPLRFFRHTHICEPQAEGTAYSDVIEYCPPLAWLTNALYVRGKIERTFEHRHRMMKRLLENPQPQVNTNP